jgi:hypothetical protein
MSLGLLLVFAQGLSCILAENIDFKQNMIGAKSTNAVIALIYDKQLKLSPATNKDFTQGEIFTFVQADATQLPAVASLPFVLIMCFALLFYYLKVTFLVGIGVFAISVFFNVFFTKRMAIF